MFSIFLFLGTVAYGGIVPDEVMVRFRPGVPEDSALRVLDSIGARQADRIDSIRLVKLPPGITPAKAIEALGAKPEVDMVEPNNVIKAAGADASDDPLLANQWHLTTIKAIQSWLEAVPGCFGSADVVIAIVDSGISSIPSDIQPKLVPGYNAIDDSANAEDDFGHGTWVAGTAAAETNNSIGIAGVSWLSKLMPIKVLDSSGKGTEWFEMKGVDWASRNGARVINMSLGSCTDGVCPPGSKSVAKAMEDAYRRGCVLVAAAGNEGTSDPSYPAAYPYVMGVSATDNNDQPASFTNFGFYIDVAAPGVQILSVDYDSANSYSYVSGTSLSSPIVAGLAAVIFGQDPSRTNDQVVAIIQSTADQPWGSSGWNQNYGYGRVNMYRALTGAAAEAPEGPTAYNFPNPFSPETDRFTTFVIRSGSGKDVSIEIYSASGDRVWSRSLSAAETSGMDLYYNSTLRWDGKDTRGKDLANGIYFAHVKVDSSRTVKKIALLR